ncbi:MAG: hypothetical protein ACRDY6_13730 [Acidimicrobiia bacterium]
MPGTYANSPTLTVQALLKQPQRISRDLTNLVVKRLVADRLFVRGTPQQVAGGAMQYQESESIYMDRDPEEIAERGDWPRTGYAEAIKEERVRQYGFEHPISNLSIRRNQMDRVTRGERKLANSLVRFIDTKAMALLETHAGIQTNASAAAWTIAGTDVIAEVGEAQEMIETQDEGYDGFEGATLVLHTKRRDDLLNNTALRAALPREVQDSQIRTGMMAPFLGVREILFTPRVTETVALLMDTGVAGTIADEQPDPREGWSAYDPGPGFAPIHVMVYEEKQPKGQVIAAGRWPAMALTDPKAVVKITGVA